jgi:peptidoglycan-associated lipoprotein
MMRRLLIAALFVGLIGSGCAEKKEVKPEETKPELEQQAREKEKGEAQKGPEKITEQTAKVESKEIPSKSDEVSGMFEDVFFEFNRYDISDSAKPVLKAAADYLIKNAGQKLLIEGHCDERGTTEYNLGLGDRRAKAAKDYLASLGIPSSRIDTISYGKEKPVCTEHSDDCWAKNRRDHLIIVKRKK